LRQELDALLPDIQESIQEGDFEMDHSALVEPISVDAANKLQAAIEALQAHHDDCYEAKDDDGWTVKVFDCRNCQHCQTIEAMKKSINALYTAYLMSPVYEDVIEEPSVDEEERMEMQRLHWEEQKATNPVEKYYRGW
jgi:hypothetical protein